MTGEIEQGREAGRTLSPQQALWLALSSALCNICDVFRGIVDELSDQRAYRCHLAAHGVTHSPDEWRRFCDEHWKAKGTRARCC